MILYLILVTFEQRLRLGMVKFESFAVVQLDEVEQGY